jgi:hypothetical protein
MSHIRNHTKPVFTELIDNGEYRMPTLCVLTYCGVVVPVAELPANPDEADCDVCQQGLGWAELDGVA